MNIFGKSFVLDDRKNLEYRATFCRIGIWRFLFSIIALGVFRQVLVAGTKSAQWSFRHKIVDEQYYSASLGIAGFSLFCKYCCLIMSRYLWKKA